MFTSILHFLLFVFIGMILDLIISTHYLFLSDGKKVGACITVWIYIIFSFLILKEIFSQETLLLTIAFATGSAIGTLVAMLIRQKGRDKSNEQKDSNHC